MKVSFQFEIKSIILKFLRKILSDKKYYEVRYLLKFKSLINWSNPQTFNEKINWLKLFDRNKLYTNLVDKYEVRTFVEKKIGDKYLIPLINVFSEVSEIKLSNLPDSFVMKATHGSGWVYLCKNKNNESDKKLKSVAKEWLGKNFYEMWGEWPYKLILPRIVIEEFIGDIPFQVPKDYKFYCFNGEPKFIHVDFDRFENHSRNFYDLNWNLLPFGLCFPRNENSEELRPVNLAEMVLMAKKLSLGLKFVRVDFYSVDGKIFFGELTFYPGNGLEKFFPAEYDNIIGRYLKL